MKRYPGIIDFDFSPDGRRLATASLDGTARVWCAETGRIQQVVGGHDGCLNSVQWVPNGRYLFTASATAAVIWNLQNNAETYRIPLTTEDGEVADRAWLSADSRWCVAGYVEEEPMVRVWRISQEREISLQCPAGKSLPSFFGTRVEAVWAEDEMIWVCILDEDDLELWGCTLHHGSTWIRHGAVRLPRDDWEQWSFSPDGRRLTVLSSGGLELMVRTESERVAIIRHGPAQREVLEPYGTRTIYSTCRRRAARLTDEDEAFLVDAESNEVISACRHAGGAIRGATFSPTGTHAATLSEDGIVRVWNLSDGAEVALFEGCAADRDRVRFSDDGTRVFVETDSGTLRTVLPIPGLPGVRSPAAASSSDRSWKLERSRAQTVRVWRPDNGATVAWGRIGTPCSTRVEIDGAGHRALTVWTAPRKGEAAFWDLATAERHVVRAGRKFDRIEAGHLARDGRRGVILGRDWRDPARQAAIVDLDDHTVCPLPHESVVARVGLSADGRLAFTGTLDTRVHVWDTDSGARLATLTGHPRVPFHGTFAPCGTQLITCAGGRLRVWDIDDAEVVAETEQPDGQVVLDSDGTRLLVIGRRGVVQVYMADGLTPLAEITHPDSPIESACFNADGSEVFLTTASGVVRRHDPVHGAQLAEICSPSPRAAFGYAARRSVAPDGQGNVLVVETWAPEQVIAIIDTRTRRDERWIRAGQQELVALEADPEGRLIAGLQADGVVRLWDTRTGAECAGLPTDLKTSALHWAPHGGRLLTLDEDWTATVWDCDTVRSPRHVTTFAGHTPLAL